jgi:hypothetical protein
VGLVARLVLAAGAFCFGAACAVAAAAERSPAVKAEFRREHPCPSTGRPTGPCPGHQVDHREALICGGRDAVDNLQWLTIEEHKTKTRVEVKLCRPSRKK